MPDTPLEPLVSSAEKGDAQSHRQLFTLLYQELRRIAERELRRVGGGSPLSPTTVLHEAYIAVAGQESVAFADRAHFMAYAARAMRGLIIDNMRSRSSLKRGGGFRITSIPTDFAGSSPDAAELEQISQALDRLSELDKRLAQVVDLRFFCGFSFAEIAALHAVSERTVQRDWDKARILLHRFLREPCPQS